MGESRRFFLHSLSLATSLWTVVHPACSPSRRSNTLAERFALTILYITIYYHILPIIHCCISYHDLPRLIRVYTLVKMKSWLQPNLDLWFQTGCLCLAPLHHPEILIQSNSYHLIPLTSFDPKSHHDSQSFSGWSRSLRVWKSHVVNIWTHFTLPTLRTRSSR